MPARIVVFGATGYTGRLTAEALVARGVQPVLAGRSAARLSRLASELGRLETAVADVARPDTVRGLVGRGDVLVATVGPFIRFGRPAVEAAVAAGAHYLDSTGEPAFIREVFESFGPAAERAGCGLVTAFGYDWVPGNLAGGLALREAGEAAVRVDTGYFFTGRMDSGRMSGGTRASTVGAIAAPAFAWRDGRIVTDRSGRRTRSFAVDGSQRPALSVGASEHFGLPRIAPQLREVNAYLGWFGGMTRPMQAMSLATSAALTLPGARRLFDSVSGRLVTGSTGGPDADARSRSGSHIVAIAYDAGGHELAEVHLTGVNGYTFTGRILAWGATHVAEAGLRGTGALGPVDGFGLEQLEAGCAEAGIARAASPRPVAA
jgi:short subunit dehydrogenase-like uncharacterized protein